jgi:UDP-N-acetylglucosamine 4,6-dehydratase
MDWWCSLSELIGKSVLVTGATGSFGKEFLRELISKDEVESITVFSRDELKQFEMTTEFASPKVKYLLGDVRDYKRVLQATVEIDIIIHAAAMKQIPAAEKNPMEAIKTNILGAENIVNAAIENGVRKVVALSTDKAANPANLYGATKLCSDKLFLSANKLSGNDLTKFSVVRYGNVLGSRGSVIPFFFQQKKIGIIPITDIQMTRFWITLNQGVDFVLKSMDIMRGGEIFVPKIPSMSIINVAKVIAPNIPIKIIGIRPGEKLHEVLITGDDARNTLDCGDHYRIFESEDAKRELLSSNSSITQVSENFYYDSLNNSQWLTEESFSQLLVQEELI